MRLEPSVSEAKKKRFRKEVLHHYKKAGRIFPWRRTKDPYRIFVSEIMLQQTQALRVVPKYKEFLKKFPSVRALANYKTRDVIRAWQGLGYNRRALYLSRAAKIIVNEHGGKFPKDPPLLERLPGIGAYTARAILTFAFDQRWVFIETNIRSAYLHFFFPHRKNVPDSLLLTLIEKTLPKKEYSRWYAALMDYGTMLKETGENPSRRSSHYSRQTPFKGSRRQLRGQVLKLLNEKALSSREIESQVGKSLREVHTELRKRDLSEEKMGNMFYNERECSLLRKK